LIEGDIHSEIEQKLWQKNIERFEREDQDWEETINGHTALESSPKDLDTGFIHPFQIEPNILIGGSDKKPEKVENLRMENKRRSLQLNIGGINNNNPVTVTPKNIKNFDTNSIRRNT